MRGGGSPGPSALKTVVPGFYVLVKAKVSREFRDLENYCGGGEEVARRFVENMVRRNFTGLSRSVVLRITDEITDALACESREESGV